jgi:HD superfamily phosphodiesterase
MKTSLIFAPGAIAGINTIGTKRMDDRQTELIKEISEKALRLLWEESFGGMAYGARHLHRVHLIAKFLWEMEGGDEFLVLAGAWVHDVSLAHGPDYDPGRVADLTRKFLKQFELLRKDETDRLVACAEGHESGGDLLSLEARIVHDADVLDKGGMLGVVRHIWKMTNMLENRILGDEYDLKKLENHLVERQERLYTATARRLANHLRGAVDHFFRDRRFALETLTWVSRLAGQGIISDRLAEELVSHSDHPCLRRLKDQLECNYLISPLSKTEGKEKKFEKSGPQVI